MSLLSNKKYIGVGVVAMALAVFVGLSKINHAPKTNVIKIGYCYHKIVLLNLAIRRKIERVSM
jgi:hypothetical protein